MNVVLIMADNGVLVDHDEECAKKKEKNKKKKGHFDT